MRFATSFLSLKFRDSAVKGESIMDKATGEIFTKRPADGRVVSFYQNKKYLHDIALRLRVLLSNNANFIYDRTSSSKLENVIFIASTTVSVHQLPKEISKKFHYVHCIRPADKSQKSNYIKWESEKKFQHGSIIKRGTKRC